ncbi:MAG: TadE/TadG family type IV pilus assembly protein, partial [Desulfobulbia bacterium]
MGASKSHFGRRSKLRNNQRLNQRLSQRGAVMIEGALFLGLIIAIFVFGNDMLRGMDMKIAMQQAASIGARSASFIQVTTDCTASRNLIDISRQA